MQKGGHLVKKVIEVKNLYKLYRVGDSIVRALNGVDFDIYEGEFCAIVGTSGSGKSTLLNMLAGLEKPTKGEVIIAGRHIEKLNEDGLVSFRRDHVGFIFQSFHLISTMNAVENVALPLSFRGVPKKERLKKADKMLDLVNLKKQKKHMPNQMSGGQQQRVGVARALVVDPEIIFADEPTGNLDSHTSEEVMALMQNVVRKQKKTLVMVTHDNHLATYADRVFHIIDGKIVKIEDNRNKNVNNLVQKKYVKLCSDYPGTCLQVWHTFLLRNDKYKLLEIALHLQFCYALHFLPGFRYYPKWHSYYL